MEQDGAQAVSKMQEDPHTEDADGQSELDGVLDGGGNAFFIAFWKGEEKNKKQRERYNNQNGFLYRFLYVQKGV